MKIVAEISMYPLQSNFHETNVSGSGNDRGRLVHGRRAGPGHKRGRATGEAGGVGCGALYPAD